MQDNTARHERRSYGPWLMFTLTLLLAILSILGCGSPRPTDPVKPPPIVAVPDAPAGSKPALAPAGGVEVESKDPSVLEDEAAKADQQAALWKGIANDLRYEAKLARERLWQKWLYITAGILGLASGVLIFLAIRFGTKTIFYVGAACAGGSALCIVGAYLVPWAFTICVVVAAIVVLGGVALVWSLLKGRTTLTEVIQAVEEVKPTLSNYKSVFKKSISPASDKLIDSIRAKLGKAKS